MEIVGILLGIIAIGLIFWFRRNQQKTNELVNTYFDNCETGMNAMMDNFNKYQIETDRKIAEQDLLKTTSKAQFEKEKLTAQQTVYLSNQWQKYLVDSAINFNAQPLSTGLRQTLNEPHPISLLARKYNR